MKNLFVRFVRNEEGQDLIEYSLLAALIAVACDRGDAGARSRHQRDLRRDRRGARRRGLRNHLNPDTPGLAPACQAAFGGFVLRRRPTIVRFECAVSARRRRECCAYLRGSHVKRRRRT